MQMAWWLNFWDRQVEQKGYGMIPYKPQDRRLRVCFMIKVNGDGLGGHYRSLRTTVEALSERLDCVIVNIGPRVSPILESIEARLHFVPFTGKEVFSAIWKISRILKQECPDVINTFDVTALFFAKVTGLRHGLPVVHTKCGGGNPRRYFPHADSLIVYSSENLEFFQSKAKFAGTPISVIPNRVKRFNCDPEKIERLREHLVDGGPCFLRINRISLSYEQSMMQCIAMVRRLNQDGHVCQLVIVGNLQDSDVLDRILKSSNENIHIFMQDDFAVNAKDIIDAADIVVGTGRGFMEAACRGKVLMTPLQGANYPLLVSKENFEKVMRTNFSPRNHIDGFDEEKNYQSIVEAIVNPGERERLGQLSIEFFNSYFNIDNGVETYLGVLESARRSGGIRVFDLLLNAYLCISGIIESRNLTGPKCIG